MAYAKLTLNHKNIGVILKKDLQPTVRKVAEGIAERAQAMAGDIDGEQVEMRIEEGPSPSRARAAAIVSHPTPSGRAAGNDALKASAGMKLEAL